MESCPQASTSRHSRERKHTAHTPIDASLHHFSISSFLFETVFFILHKSMRATSLNLIHWSIKIGFLGTAYSHRINNLSHIVTKWIFNVHESITFDLSIGLREMGNQTNFFWGGLTRWQSTTIAIKKKWIQMPNVFKS